MNAGRRKGVTTSVLDFLQLLSTSSHPLFHDDHSPNSHSLNPIPLGKAIIQSSLSRIAKKQHPDPTNAKKYIDDVFSRIKTSQDPAVEADLVIEAIVENLAIKQKFWSDLDKKMNKNTIFASNTSSLPITKIAEAVSDERKKKFAGLHFFNPVPQMKLVEVIKADKTTQVSSLPAQRHHDQPISAGHPRNSPRAW